MLEYGLRFRQIKTLVDEHQIAVSRASLALPGQRNFDPPSVFKTDVYTVDTEIDALYLGASAYRPQYPTPPVERASEWSMKHGVTLDRIVNAGDNGFEMYPHFSMVRSEPRATARRVNLSAGYVVRFYSTSDSVGRQVSDFV